MKYYLIAAKDAVELRVTDFRRGNQEKGYVVTAGDLSTAPEEVRDSAKEMTEAEAIDYIIENKL